MRRLVYAPKAYVYIQTEDGKVHNISDKVVSGTVHRKVNQVSEATVTFQNPDRRFTKPGNPTFKPMDKITIFLQRLPKWPCQVFTGFLDTAPYYQMYPGTCTIKASCTLKKLQYTYFDPGVPFMRTFLARYGWVEDDTGAITNMTGPDGGGSNSPSGSATVLNNGLAYPLSAHGKDLGGIAAHAARAWGNWQSDNAVDIGVPQGTDVYAVEDGTITRLTGEWRGAAANPNGYNITLDGESGHQWWYTHLRSRADLQVGQKVKKGDFFGKSGAANNVEHLHIAVDHGDPEVLLGLKSGAGRFGAGDNSSGNADEGNGTTTSRGSDAQYRASASMTDLIFATLKHIGGIDAGHIYIEALPESLVDRIAVIYNALQNEATEATEQYKEWLKAYIGTSSAGNGGMSGDSSSVGGASGGPAAFREAANKWGPKYNVDPWILMGFAEVETGFGTVVGQNGTTGANATSSAGAKGYTQFMPATRDDFLRRFHVDAWGSVDEAIHATAIYMKTSGYKPGDLSAMRRAIYAYNHANWYVDEVLKAGEKYKGHMNDGNTQTDSDGKTGGPVIDEKSGLEHGGAATPDSGGSTKLAKMVPNTAPTGWPGSGGSYGATRSYGAHAGVDVPSTLGENWCAAVDGTITAVASSWTEGTGCVVLKPDEQISGYPKGVRLGYGGTQSILVKVGQHVKAGDVIAKGGSHGSGPHLHFFMRTDDTAANGTMDPTPFAKASQGGTAVENNGSNDASDTGTSADESSLGYGDVLAASRAAGVNTVLNFPQAVNMEESLLMTGGRSLMNDQPLLPFIQQLCSGTMRSFQSLPNGDFYAWHADYFGAMGTAPYWEIDDIEVLSGDIQLSDDNLITHYFVTGSTIPGDDQNSPIDVFRKLQSRGVVNIFNAGSADFLNIDPNQKQDHTFLGNYDATVNFLKRYGARPMSEEAPFIRSHIFETFYAFEAFMLAWARQFLSTFTFTFMPEIYPGGIVEFKQQGIQMYVDEVIHSWDYSSGFTTQANLSAPASTEIDPSKKSISSGMIRSGLPGADTSRGAHHKSGKK